MISPKVWIIQNDFEKLKIALSSINKKSMNNFLCTNCISHFNFDNVVMSTKNFNSFLYCQDNNMYILFMKDSIDKLNYTIQYLDDNNIQYHEIAFKNEKEDIINRYPNSLHNHEKNSKEIWIVNNENDLKSLLKYLLTTNKAEILNYYPLLDSNINLLYSNNCDEEINMSTFSFKGAITIKDIIILLTCNINNNSISIKFVLDTLDINYTTIEYNKPKFINTEDKRNKKFYEQYQTNKTKSLIKYNY